MAQVCVIVDSRPTAVPRNKVTVHHENTFARRDSTFSVRVII